MSSPIAPSDTATRYYRNLMVDARHERRLRADTDSVQCSRLAVDSPDSVAAQGDQGTCRDVSPVRSQRIGRREERSPTAG